MKFLGLFIFVIAANSAQAGISCTHLLDSTAGLDFVERDGVTIVMDGPKRLAGDFRYDYRSEDQELYIDQVDISSKYKGRGIYKKMMVLVLKKHPDIKTITASLISDNLSAYISEKTKILRNRPHQMTLEEAGVEALKNTPTYKVGKALGFSKIIEHTRHEPDRNYMNDRGSVKMIVERDDL